MRDSRDLHILLCSHLLRDVEETCEEVLILKDGHQVHYANLEEERRANRRFLELETLGDDGTFAEAVESLGCECATSGRRLKMVLGQDFAMRDLYRLAEEHGVQIRRLNYRRDSLEDIFLKAMENSNGRP
jgi:ABC-2 type transport system ATP-binding protein